MLYWALNNPCVKQRSLFDEINLYFTYINRHLGVKNNKADYG